MIRETSFFTFSLLSDAELIGLSRKKWEQTEGTARRGQQGSRLCFGSGEHYTAKELDPPRLRTTGQPGIALKAPEI